MLNRKMLERRVAKRGRPGDVTLEKLGDDEVYIKRLSAHQILGFQMSLAPIAEKRANGKHKIVDLAAYHDAMRTQLIAPSFCENAEGDPLFTGGDDPLLASLDLDEISDMSDLVKAVNGISGTSDGKGRKKKVKK